MKSLSRITLVATAFGLGLAVCLGSGLPVVDVAAISQALQQYEVAVQHLEQLKIEMERLGDPKLLKTPAATALIQSLSQIGAGRTLVEIQTAATGEAGTAFDANGLFRPPKATLQTADGQILSRALPEYRKFDAIAQAVLTHEQVMYDTQGRRQSLREQIQGTLRDLQTATSMAEVHKIQALLEGQNAQLGAIDREREAAFSRVQVQQVYNQTDDARQQQAHREETEAGVRQATDKLGQLFKVDTSTVSIPNPLTP